MRGIARQLALVGVTVSTTVFAFDGSPSVAGVAFCGPRSVSVLDVWVEEGGPPGGSTLGFTVSTVGCAGGSVDYQTVAGASGLSPATAGVDFVAKSGTLTWAPNDVTSRTVNVAVIGDFHGENDEGITLSLSSPIGLSISDDSGRGRIIDDDVVIFLFSEPFCPGENCLDCRIVARSNNPVPTDTIVYFATRDGTATAGEDYVPITNGSVVIRRGTTEAVIGNLIVNDRIAEPAENFIVSIKKVSAGRIGSPDLNVLIIDDDS